MERMNGVPISQMQRLRDAGVDIPKLARDGVTIFFTQVFRDGFFHADMHPGNIQVQHRAGDLRPLHRARLRHRRHADRVRQGIPGAELHRLLPARLQARRRAARRKRLGAAEHARRRARRRDPRRLRAALRPAAEGHLARPGAAAPVPDLAPLQRRDPAAAGAAAEDAAQRRGPGPPARPRARPVEHRQAVPRALDGRAGRLARAGRAAARTRRRATSSCCPQLPRLLHRRAAAAARRRSSARSRRCWPSSGAPTGCCRRSIYAGRRLRRSAWSRCRSSCELH